MSYLGLLFSANFVQASDTWGEVNFFAVFLAFFKTNRAENVEA